MGAALAVIAASAAPERVSGLLLIAPAGLPLSKPIRDSALDFARQVRAGRHEAGAVLESAADLLRAPRAALRLALALRNLDLSREMRTIARARVPATVIGCATDTLVTPAHCRRAAALLGARYRELALDGGHTWMFGRWHLLAGVLANP